MHQHVDPVLFLVGLARVGVWLAITIVAWRARRLLPVLYAPAAAITSAVFTITNAHGQAPQWMSTFSTFLALPIPVLILCSLLVTRPTLPAPHSRHGWHL